jgi:iron-sulfur cluster assembly protein
MSSVETKQESPGALVSATEAALAELKRLLSAETEADGVRMGVKGGGCSGLSYALSFGTQREGDHVVELGGVRFYLDRKSSIYLKGIEVDYKHGLSGKGFVFKNPNASSTCGCGESFSV